MTREEMLERGFGVFETRHSMKRRARWHDYSVPGTYMVTIVVEGRRPLLGRLTGGSCPEVVLTELGSWIFEKEILTIPAFYPQVEVWKVCMMPDHIHMILRVKEALPDGKHLGHVVGGFKGGCTRAWRRLTGASAPGTAASAGASGGATVPHAEALVSLFETGYNDKILLNDGQLDGWKKYLDDNPRRLAIKRLNPSLFTVINNIELGGMKCQCFGNMFLLNIPDKMEVIVHRADSQAVFERKFSEWMACGERGGVLVSASIAPLEKKVMREAMNRRYNMILLRENGFLQLYKPGGEAFYACAAGRLLELSPWEHHYDRRVITRKQCLDLNTLAISIGRSQ